MNRQVCKPLRPLSGSNLASYGTQVDRYLQANLTWRFHSVQTIPISKIGGIDYEMFVIFDVDDVIDTSTFRGGWTEEQARAQVRDFNKLCETVRDLRTKNDELERSFDLYHNASMSLIRAYKRLHPEFPEDSWPDTATVNEWAANLIDKLVIRTTP